MTKFQKGAFEIFEEDRETSKKLYDKFFDNNKIKVTAVIGENGSEKLCYRGFL